MYWISQTFGVALIQKLRDSLGGEENLTYTAVQTFFLTRSSLSTTITNADILPGYKTDHSLISIHLANKASPRGAGFLDEEYVGLIKKTITDLANEYANNNEMGVILLWDTMKIQIRLSSLNYARRKKAKMKSLELKLESEIFHSKTDFRQFARTLRDFLHETCLIGIPSICRGGAVARILNLCLGCTQSQLVSNEPITDILILIIVNRINIIRNKSQMSVFAYNGTENFGGR